MSKELPAVVPWTMPYCTQACLRGMQRRKPWMTSVPEREAGKRMKTTTDEEEVQKKKNKEQEDHGEQEQHEEKDEQMCGGEGKMQ